MSFEFVDFSSISFAELLQSLQKETPTEALQQLSSILLYGDNDFFKDLPIIDYAISISKIFSSPASSADAILAATCIHGLIEAHPLGARAFEKAKILESVGEYLIDIKSSELASHCLQILSTISIQRPFSISEQCGFSPLIKNINSFSIPDQKNAIKTLEHITCFPFDKKNSAVFLDPICELFTHHDSFMVLNSVKAFSNIASVCDLETIPISVIEKIAVSLQILTDGTCVYLLVKSLERLALNSNLAQEIINQYIDFEAILEQTKAKGKFMDILKSSLFVLSEIIPPHTYFEKPFINRELKGAAEYAISFEEFVVNLLLNKVGCVSQCLRIFSAISRYQIPKKIDEILLLLAAYATQTELKNDVLIVLINLSDKSILKNQPVMSILQYVKVEHFDEILSQIDESNIEQIEEIPKISDISQLCKIVQMKPFIFFTAKGIERCTEFLSEFDLEITSELANALKKLASICHELISLYPLPEEEDPLDSSDAKKFMKKVLKLNVQCGETTVSDINAELTLDFAAVENWFNQRNGLTQADLKAVMLTDKEFAPLISENELDNGGNTKGALLNRAFHTPKYQKYIFKIEDKTFSVHESIFQAFCSIIPDANAFKTKILTITLIPSDSDDIARTRYEIRDIAVPSIDPILMLLACIHKIAPKLDLVCDSFSNHILPHLSSPFLTIGHFSFATSIIYRYPFLFPLHIRLLFCKLTAFDVPFALFTTHQKFVETSDNTKFDQVRVKVKIDRNNIFHDGLLTLERLGPGRCYFDVWFENETGIGNGPTQEFFSLFSREFCRNSRKIWRSDESSSEYAFSAKGLFPRPDVDPHLMYILGLLCAKAFSMQVMIQIQFNSALFSFIRGEKIDISDVDPIMAKSLEFKEGLYDLTFVYPGIPDLELINNGKEIIVDESNVNEYISLIKEFTCGSKLSELSKKFKEGFQSVIPWEAIDVFTANEFSLLLFGENLKISMEELTSNVEVAHGYQINSPQIQNLFEVITEFDEEELKQFLMFITGSQMMPVGGLEQFRPKLTVAKRAQEGQNGCPDDYLPSVMTCMNYLKLPMYSSKEVLRQKLFLAIFEGRNSFDLT